MFLAKSKGRSSREKLEERRVIPPITDDTLELAGKNTEKVLRFMPFEDELEICKQALW